VLDSNTYGVLRSLTGEETYRKIVEAVGGTNAPLFFVGHFEGVITVEVFFTTDLPSDLFGLSAGDLTQHTASITATDSQGTPVSKTASITGARCFKRGITHKQDEGFMYNFTLDYGTQVNFA
jgi:hypothetical protein